MNTNLRELYTDSYTTLCVENKCSEPIKVTCGIKQGNPVSVHLFNMVIDWALSELDSSIGIKIGETRFNNLAFANGIALLTQTPLGAASLLKCPHTICECEQRHTHDDHYEDIS